MGMEKILVIEDEAELLEEIVEWFQFEGYEVYHASGGSEGIRLAQEHLPDLIVSDIMMPYVDGYRVLLELRTKPETSLIPFIFLSALADRRDVRRGMSLGADDYVTKPFVRNELLDAVRVRLAKQAENKRRMSASMDELRIGLSVSLPHELRTPLTSIIGYGELLSLSPGGYTPEGVAEIAGMIVNAGERLMRLVDNYLLFAQLELAKDQPVAFDEEYSPARSTVSDAALRAVQSYRREVDLHMEVSDALVDLPYELLDRAIYELVDNACKFSKTGSPIHVVSTVDETYWVLRVSDHGRGMGPEEQQRVDAYIQFQRKLYEQQGSGLGLAITRRIAERCGGEFRIDSKIGKGTNVEIRLPLVK